MKTLKLVFIIFIYIFIVYYYFNNKKSIKNRYTESFPPLFSENNKNIISVTKMQKEKTGKSTDEISLIPNNEFLYDPDDFQIDDTDQLKSLDLWCKPDSFGYTIERGNEIFPYHGYPKCSQVNEQMDTYAHIDRKNNKVYMDCPDNTNQEIIIGPYDDSKIIYRQEGHKKWKTKEYKDPIPATGVEFVLGKCKKDDGLFLQGDMNPIFNKTAYEKALGKVNGKPKIVYFLTLDSLSRRHFFRKLPRVIKYMNDLNKNSSYSVFDFKLHNNMADTSPKNQVPIFSGDNTYSEYKVKNKNQDILKEKSLWYKLREKGYISHLGFEDCDGSFLNYLGRYPDVEYSAGPFYCAVETFTESGFRKENTVQRCIGGHQTHYFILNFTDTIVDMNYGVNMMLYNHLNAAHEYTGQHAETLNDDITEYLQNFIRKYGKDYEILIFMQADHGMRYGAFFHELDAYQENKLPAFFLIASKSLLEKYPYSYHALTINTERLTSKMDYRKTVLAMENIIEESAKSVDLFSETASKSRTCTQMGIRPWDCACLKMVELTSPSKLIKNLVEFLKDYAENLINSQSYSFSKYPEGKICKKIELENVEKIYHTGINNVEELYKLEITSETRKNLKFQITYSLVSDGKYMQATKRRYRYESTSYLHYPIKIRVFNI